MGLAACVVLQEKCFGPRITRSHLSEWLQPLPAPKGLSGRSLYWADKAVGCEGCAIVLSAASWGKKVAMLLMLWKKKKDTSADSETETVRCWGYMWMYRFEGCHPELSTVFWQGEEIHVYFFALCLCICGGPVDDWLACLLHSAPRKKSLSIISKYNKLGPSTEME